MNWQEVCDCSELQNLPFKIELNARGQIIMSPVRVFHSLIQGEVEHFLRQLTQTGKVAPECAIETRLGTKVVDVVWMSLERYHQIKHEIAASIAPEICVEVLSPSNTDEEMEEKRTLYFEQGAQEVWLCDEEGRFRFYDSTQELKRSGLLPAFPLQIKI